jgi:hypothetical protein
MPTRADRLYLGRHWFRGSPVIRASVLLLITTFRICLLRLLAARFSVIWGPAMVYRKVWSGATLMRLNERYADYLAVDYLAFWRFDMRSNGLRSAITIQAAAS